MAGHLFLRERTGIYTAASSSRISIQTGCVADLTTNSIWSITYGEIARRLEEKQNTSRMSAQAVGGAVGTYRYDPFICTKERYCTVGDNKNRFSPYIKRIPRKPAYRTTVLVKAAYGT